MKHLERLLSISLCTVALAISPLVRAGQIIIGQVAPLSGPGGEQAQSYSAGMNLYFSKVNSNGGVRGHMFLLRQRDNQGNEQLTLRLSQHLVNDEKAIVLAGYVDNRSINTLVRSGFLDKAKVALVGYRSYETYPENAFLYNVRATLADEIKKLTQQLATTGIKRIGLLYEEGQEQAEFLKAAKDTAKISGVAITQEASYPAETSQVSGAVDVFLQARPEAILLLSSGRSALRFIEQYRNRGGSAQVLVHSAANMEEISQSLGENRLAFVTSVLRGVTIAQVIPSPYALTSAVAQELNDILRAESKGVMPITYAMMEGYLTAKVIVEAVRRQAAFPTKEGTIAALDGIDYLDLGGYVIGFRPGRKNGSNTVELSIISNTGKIIR